MKKTKPLHPPKYLSSGDGLQESMATIKYYVGLLQLVNEVPFIFSLKQTSTLYAFGCLWVIRETQYEVVENQGGHSGYPQAVAPCITVTTRTAQ
jgi:hypothetical protein